MLDSEAPGRRRGPGRHRRTLTRQHGPMIMTLLHTMNAWLTGLAARNRNHPADHQPGGGEEQ